MFRHVVTSAAVMSVGLVPLVHVWRRHGEGEQTVRRFAVAFPLLLLTIATISAMSTVTRTRCPGNPIEWCEYNDSTPAMAVIAVGFTIAAIVRAWMLYAER